MAAACFTLATLVIAAPAHAADWFGEPSLRGTLPDLPAATVSWDGLYIGGSAGIANMNTDFGDSTHSMVAYLLRNTTIQNEQHPSDWTTLGSDVTRATSYGGFIGYNMQWDELVLGIDVGYNHMASGAESSASDTMSRQFSTSDGFQNNLTVTASSSIKLKDYATVRGRVGYPVGQFLPYATLGLAVGRFDYLTSVHIVGNGTPPSGSSALPYTIDQSSSEGKDNAIVAGLEAGLGMDVAFTPNIFLRGEWEYIAFAQVHGMRVNTNTGRVGLALKF
jgi:outer membrane immunogenic protein